MKSFPPRLALLLLVMTTAASGCAVWKPVASDRVATTLEESPKRVLVATDRSMLDLRRVELRADTLHAYRPSTSGFVSIPLSSVVGMSVRRVDRDRTRTLVGAVLFASAIVVAVVTVHQPIPGQP